MSGAGPNYCRREAWELLAAQGSRLDTTDGLLAGAVAIAMHDSPAASVAEARGRIDELADAIRQRVRGSDPEAILAHAHEVLFEEQGFTGNLDNYYDPRNSYLPAVLATRRGIPITLSLVYRLVMERLGLTAMGINAPLHFMAAVDLDGTRMLVDPFFGGRVLSRWEAIERIAHALDRPISQTEELLPVATHRQWLLRMIANLVNVFNAMHRRADLAAMHELAALLQPNGEAKP